MKNSRPYLAEDLEPTLVAARLGLDEDALSDCPASEGIGADHGEYSDDGELLELRVTEPCSEDVRQVHSSGSIAYHVPNGRHATD